MTLWELKTAVGKCVKSIHIHPWHLRGYACITFINTLTSRIFWEPSMEGAVQTPPPSRFKHQESTPWPDQSPWGTKAPQFPNSSTFKATPEHWAFGYCLSLLKTTHSYHSREQLQPQGSLCWLLGKVWFRNRRLPLRFSSHLPCFVKALMAWAIQTVLIKQLGYSVIFLGPVFSASSIHLPQQGPCLCIPRCPKMSVSTQHPKRERWLRFWEVWIWVRENMSYQLCDPSTSQWGIATPTTSSSSPDWSHDFHVREEWAGLRSLYRMPYG